MSIDQRSFRNALGSFATGVTVVTSVNPENQQPVGVTVSAFSSLSLEPPMVLFCLGNKTASLKAFEKSGYFCVNVLAEPQRDISTRFASRSDDKFAGVDWQAGQGGVPVLAGALASLQCKLTQVLPGGDHMIFIGEVLSLSVDEAAAPLIYFRGGYMDSPAV